MVPCLEWSLLSSTPTPIPSMSSNTLISSKRFGILAGLRFEEVAAWPSPETS